MSERERDGCVVPSLPLAGLLCQFVDEWHRDRPSTAGRFAKHGTRTEVSTISPLDWLEQESHVPKHVIAKIATRDPSTGTPKPRTEYTELRVADALVTAIGNIEVLQDGTLPIVVNDAATAANREVCRRCGGIPSGRPARGRTTLTRRRFESGRRH